MAKREYREASEETKKKQSIKKMGINNPTYGKPRSEETKQKISLALKKRWKEVPSKHEVLITTKNNELTTELRQFRVVGNKEDLYKVQYKCTTWLGWSKWRTLTQSMTLDKANNICSLLIGN